MVAEGRGTCRLKGIEEINQTLILKKTVKQNKFFDPEFKHWLFVEIKELLLIWSE